MRPGSTFEIVTQIILLQIYRFLRGWILNITPLKDCPCPTKRNAVAHKELRAKKIPTPTPWLTQHCKSKPCKAYRELPVSQFYPVMTL